MITFLGVAMMLGGLWAATQSRAGAGAGAGAVWPVAIAVGGFVTLALGAR